MKCIVSLLLASLTDKEKQGESDESRTALITNIQQLLTACPVTSYEALFEALLAQLLPHPHGEAHSLAHLRSLSLSLSFSPPHASLSLFITSSQFSSLCGFSYLPLSVCVSCE
jgi:hypothetical protein